MNKSRIDPQALWKEYVVEGKPLREVGAVLGVTGQTVANALKRHGYPKHPRAVPLRIRERLRLLGCKHISEFFILRSRSSLKSMAAELGVSGACVASRYRKFVEEWMASQEPEAAR